MKRLYIVLLVLLGIQIQSRAQWVQQTSGTTNDLHSVYFTDANTGYAVGEYVTILKTTDGGVAFTPEKQTNNYLGISIYPNPANGVVSIKCKIQSSEKEKSYTIYNSMGQMIIQGELTGEETQVDMSGYPNGIYVVKVTTEEGSIAKKLIKN